jgi:nitrate/TMAO reductase-like tetraheme cytochrome c subunit
MASPDKPTADRPAVKVTGPRRRRRLTALAVVAGVLAVLGFGALALGTPVSERPTSCIVCHDMKPFYDAWTVGAHSGGKASCVDCHVDQGLLNHWVNSVVALREIAGEVTGQGTFPRADVILPSSRCVRCHPTQKNTLVGIKFTHAGHASKVTCSQCHIQTGHAVTDAALAQVGALDAARASSLKMATMTNSQAWVLPGTTPMSAAHLETSCWACHDPAKVGCGYCHTTNPHAATTSNCAECHKPPAGHFTTACAKCHQFGRPFNQPQFAHPAAGEQHTWQSFPCVQCHPNGYATADCTTCHAGQGVGD